MYLGMSKIRSAGRTSGSIEITLPPVLQVFIGLGCRVVVRDGLQPEIVLQPDLMKTRSLLGVLWQKLSLVLGCAELVDDFNSKAFILTLLPTRSRNGDLSLAYADIVALSRGSEEWDEEDMEAFARVLSVVAAGIGQTLGLQQSLALAFGDAVAYVVTQIPAGFASDFERSMAGGFFRQAQLHARRLVAPFDHEFWRESEPALRRICRQFLIWQNEPDEYRIARQQWNRALQCESVAGCAEQRAAGHSR